MSLNCSTWPPPNKRAKLGYMLDTFFQVKYPFYMATFENTISCNQYSILQWYYSILYICHGMYYSNFIGSLVKSPCQYFTCCSLVACYTRKPHCVCTMNSWWTIICLHGSVCTRLHSPACNWLTKPVAMQDSLHIWWSPLIRKNSVIQFSTGI